MKKANSRFTNKYAKTYGYVDGNWVYIGMSKVPGYGITYKDGFGYYNVLSRKYKFEK